VAPPGQRGGAGDVFSSVFIVIGPSDMPQDGTRNATHGPLRATLAKVGDVWRADYLAELNPEHPDARALPDSHIGTTEAEVRWWVEQMARGMGYAGVEWVTP
jgi:hypothetical protein